MAPISALLLITSLVAAFLCVQRAVILLAAPLNHAWILVRTQELKPFETIQERLNASTIYSKARKSVLLRKRAEDLQAAMPEAIRLICIALDSGSSMVVALRYAAENCSSPLSEELKRTVCDLEAGRSFDESLESLRQRTGGTEFAYLAVAMEIQHQSGGSLTPILDNVGALLKQSSNLKEDLKTKTEQARLSSRIVAIMPFFLLVILSLFTPGYFASFFSSPLGVCLLALALSLEVVGILLVRRCLAIDFSLDLEEVA